MFEKLSFKHTTLKNMHSLVTKDFDSLNNGQINLKQDCSSNTILEKFTQGSKTLKNIINIQICVFDKSDLGYKHHVNQKYFKSYFSNDHRYQIHQYMVPVDW